MRKHLTIVSLIVLLTVTVGIRLASACVINIDSQDINENWEKLEVTSIPEPNMYRITYKNPDHGNNIRYVVTISYLVGNIGLVVRYYMIGDVDVSLYVYNLTVGCYMEKKIPETTKDKMKSLIQILTTEASA